MDIALLWSLDHADLGLFRSSFHYFTFPFWSCKLKFVHDMCIIELGIG